MSASRAFSVYYIYDPSDKPEGWGGNDRGGWAESMIQAIDYKTGKVKWSHKWEDGGRSGLLSTAGKLLFAGDGSANLVALDPANGNPVWHANLGMPSPTARSLMSSMARSTWWSRPATPVRFRDAAVAADQCGMAEAHSARCSTR